MSLPDYGGLEREGSIGATVNRPGGNALSRALAVGAALIALSAVVYFGFLAEEDGNEPDPVIQNEEFVPPQAQLQQGFPEPRPPEIPKFEVPFVPEPPPPPPEPQAPPPEPVVIAPPPPAEAEPAPPSEPDCTNPKDREHPTCLALEEERKRLARLNSPLTVVDAASTASVPIPGAASDAAAEPGTGARPAGQVESDPFRAFLNDRSNAGVETSTAVPNRRPDATILQGAFIRGILETAINSDLPGQVRAVVTQDIYSFDGRRILIPSGARLIGDYRSGITRGQERVFIVWTRLIRPDGASIQLGSFGTDSLGRSGMTGIVDSKFLERFGSAVLLSVIGGAAQFVATLGNPTQQQSQDIRIVDPVTGAITIIPGHAANALDQRLATAKQIGANTASQTLTQLANEALKDGLQVQPTIHIRQGERITVFVGRDLDFSGLFPDPVREEFERLKALHRARGKGREAQ